MADTMGIRIQAAVLVALVPLAAIDAAHAQSPNVQVQSPTNISVARPRIRITASCSDDNPSGCTSLAADIVEGSQVLATLASSSSVIDTEVDLTAFDGQSVDLRVRGTNGAGQTTDVHVDVFVERSSRLRKVTQVPGEIWDVDAQRILYSDLGSNIYSRDRLTGADTVIFSTVPPYVPSNPLSANTGFLTPVGAAFIVHDTVCCGTNIKSWENGSLVTLQAANLPARAGKYLLWSTDSSGGPLVRRDVTTATNFQVAPVSGVPSGVGAVGANGQVAWIDASFHLWVYQLDGQRIQLAPPRPYVTSAVTDGDSILYTNVSDLACVSCGTETINLYRSGAHVGLTGDIDSLGLPMDIVNGWVAWPFDFSSDGAIEIWRMDAHGTMNGLSTLSGGDSTLDKLGDDGTVLFRNFGRRLMSVPPGSVSVDVGSAMGKPIFIGGLPHVAIGNSLFVVQPVASSLNGAARSSLLWRNSATGEVFRMLMNGANIQNGALVYVEPNTAWKIVGDADFNGDGISDLLWRNDSTGQLFLMPFGANGFPSGGSFVYTEPNAAWKIVATPDLDGDGRADIVLWNSVTGQVYGLLMDGFTIKAQGSIYAEPNTDWKIVAVGDFAGTNRQSGLLWRNSATGAVAIVEVTASVSSFGVAAVQVAYTEPNTDWKIVAAADFNGDGRTDILYRNDSTGRVFMLFMNGLTVAGGGLVYSEPNLDWKIVAVGDYNGDGYADILYRNFSSGRVYMLQMKGIPRLSAGLVYVEPNLDWHVLGPYEYAQ